MNWIPRRSLYNETVMNRAKLRANAREYMDRNASIASAFSQIQINDSFEAGNIASKAAMRRIIKSA